ncbi:hypothetical protein SESBI_28712 [Sesbania bispinosa]|nr:hypothetical protein SESBI_28712 [Sesbania bispinosa]
MELGSKTNGIERRNPKVEDWKFGIRKNENKPLRFSSDACISIGNLLIRLNTVRFGIGWVGHLVIGLLLNHMDNNPLVSEK